MELKGRVALVTGAGSGIGAAAALRMAREGALVGLLGRTRGELEEVASRIAAEGAGRALVLEADVTDASAMQQAVERLAAEGGGRFDILLANAGVNGVWAPIEELTPEEWDRTMAINLRGTFLSLRAAIPAMRGAGHGGSVVITASINGTRTFTTPGASAYASSKAAQLAFGKMAAVELAPHRIRVNVICPGQIDTEIGDNTQSRNAEAAEFPREFPRGEIPLTGRTPGTAEEVAELVLFLASDRAAHVTGTEVYIDGAQSLVV